MLSWSQFLESKKQVLRMPNLTKRHIECLEPQEKEFISWDEKISGFGVKVSPKGRKTYIYKYRNASGKQRKPSIGVHGKITCEQAREIARKWAAQIAMGEDPMEERHQKRSEMTFDELFSEYMKRHSRPHKKSWKYDEEQYQRHIKAPLGGKKLSAISQEDIARLHGKLAEESGKGTANHILSLVKAIYNKAVEWGYYKEQPPARFVKKFKEKSRERFLQPEEAPRFFQALDMEENQTLKHFIYILLYTGQRKGNVRSMRWQDISFDRQEWHIPETKNGESHTVPLVPQAVELLKERRKATMDSIYVFPSNSAAGYLRDPKRAWRRLLKRAEIENLTMHDLRRTMGSYLAMAGANQYLIGKTLGHKDPKSTAIYARMNLDPVREAMGNVGDFMNKLKEAK